MVTTTAIIPPMTTTGGSTRPTSYAEQSFEQQERQKQEPVDQPQHDERDRHGANEKDADSDEPEETEQFDHPLLLTSRLLGKLRRVELIRGTTRGVGRQVPSAATHPLSKTAHDQRVVAALAELSPPGDDDKADEEDEHEAGRVDETLQGPDSDRLP